MLKRTALAVIGLLLALGAIGADAQTRINGVGFDDTPVELNSVQQSTPRAITSMDLLTLRDLHGLQISPDGKSVAFVVGQAIYDSNSYRSGLFVVGTAPGSLPISLGTAGPPHWDRLGDWDPEAPLWSPDSRYVTYRLLTDGKWQVWRWKRDGSEARQVTHAPYDVRSYEWARDELKIVFVVSKPVDTGDVKRIQEHGILYDGGTAVFQNRSILEQELSRRPAKTDTWIADIVSGTERQLSPAEEKQANAWKQKLGDKIVDIDSWASGDFGNILEPKLSPDGKKVIYCLYNSPPVSGHASIPLYLKVLGGGAAITLNPGAFRVPYYWWSLDSKSIYFAESRGDGRSRSLFVVSSDGGEPRRISPDARGEFLDEYSVDDGGKFAACVRENNTMPPEVAIVDLHTGMLRTLVNVNPQFQDLLLSPANRIEWVSKYGEAGHGYLVLPLNYEKGKRYPLIVTTYSAGDYFLRGGTGDEYPIQVFAANGFSVLAWDEGRWPAEPTDGNFEEAMLRLRWPMASLEAALKKLDGMGIVASNRMGLTGYSFGTEITQFAISHSQLFQAAIACGGGGDSPYFYYMAPKYWKQEYVKWGMGGWPEGESSSRWHEYSSALNAPRIHTPFLSNASEDDFMTTFELVTSLEQLGKPVELFIYPNELHTKVQPKHRYEIYSRNLDWFRFWFESKEDPDPTKKGQYERWRHLRDLRDKDSNH